MDFQKDLDIDKFSLDDEWAKQPSTFHKWSMQLAEAEMERDKAKEEIDLVRAELDLAIRTDPIKFKLEKITESAVNSAIITNEKYRKSLDEYNQLKYNHRIIQSAIESLNHKKYALDNLVRLFLSEYYLRDAPPKDRTAMLEEMDKDVNLKRRLNRARTV
jgi:hypothetical protein